MSAPIAEPLDHERYRTRTYFPELDGLRGLSVLLVVAYHMVGFRDLIWTRVSGAGGVLIFFVLSGFLITTLGLREEAQRGRVSLAAFYVRRTFRIFPLYYFMLIVYGLLLAGLAFPADLKQLPNFWEHLPWMAGYMQDVSLHCRPIAGPTPPFSHAWTLGVEEKFYFVWPLLLFVLWRHAGPSRRLGYTFALTVGLALLTLALSCRDGACHNASKCLVGHCHILVGCLLAQALHDRRWFERLRPLATPGRFLLAVGLLLLTLAALPQAKHIHHRLPLVLEALYTGLTATVLVGLLLLDGPIQRLLCWRPLLWFGRMSYGIYLVHMIVMATIYQMLPTARDHLVVNLLAFPLVCATSAAVAWGLALMIEGPAIEVGRRLSRRLLNRPARIAARQENATQGGLDPERFRPTIRSVRITRRCYNIRLIGFRR